MATRPEAHPLGVLLSVLLAGAVIVSVWVPELSHWYVRPDPIPSTVLEALRRALRGDVLDEMGAMRLSPMLIEREQVVPAAESAMRGTLQLSGFPAARITLPFSGDDLVRTPTAWQLLVASLAGADILWGISSIAPEIVSVFVSAKWQAAIFPMQIIALAMPLTIVGAIVSTVVKSLGRGDVIALDRPIVGAGFETGSQEIFQRYAPKDVAWTAYAPTASGSRRWASTASWGWGFT